MLIDYNEVNSYQVYNLLIKKVKTYHDVKFYKYETTHNINISNKFQYAEFNKYKKLKTVKIDISESINQNIFTEFNIKPSTEALNINFSDVFQNVSSESTNTNIASHYSEYNQQFIYH